MCRDWTRPMIQSDMLEYFQNDAASKVLTILCFHFVLGGGLKNIWGGWKSFWGGCLFVIASSLLFCRGIHFDCCICFKLVESTNQYSFYSEIFDERS